MKRTSKKLVCTSAASRFYTKGAIYSVYVDFSGHEYLKGSDGIFDKRSNVLSKFKTPEGNELVVVDGNT